MFGAKKLICLIFLITICYEVNAQIEEVVVWDLVRAISQGAYYIFKGIMEGKSFFDNVNSPPELNSTYRYMSLKNNIQEIHKKLENLPSAISDLTLIKNLVFYTKESTIEIDSIYQQYIHYLNGNQSSYNLLLFAEAIINIDVGIPHKILKIHSNFIGHDKYNLAFLIEKYIEVLEPFCSAQQTRQQYFYDLFISVLSHEFKAYALLDYAYNTISKVKNINQESEKMFMKRQFKDRINKTVSLFDDILLRSSRNLWKCDPDKHVKGKTYEELNLFRSVFYHEPDLIDEEADCTYRCDIPKEGIKPRCQEKGTCYLEKQRKCNKVISCSSIHKSYSYVLCLPQNQDFGRRYSVVEKTLADPIIMAIAKKKHTCDGEYKSLFASIKRKLIFPLKCPSCKCICDEGDDADRYISMRMATSDIENNYIVTGAKIILKKQVIYLQIQQGQLLPGGFVSDSSVNWKAHNAHHDTYTAKYERTKNYTADSYGDLKKFTLDWYGKRGLYFNDMSLPRDEVVTGLRFIYDSSGSLALDMRSTPLNITSGELFASQSYWYTSRHPDIKRSYLNLQKSDAPALTGRKNKPGNIRQQYTHFGTTGPETNDGQQSTIPFIDTQDVTTKPAMPLSGISLDIKREDNTGGFIMLRLNTYNVMWLSQSRL